MNISKTRGVIHMDGKSPLGNKEGLNRMSAMDTKDLSTVVRSPRDADGNRLDTWKEIAVYLNREVRTVQRWEKREGLPVHGHFHMRGRTVYALKEEIDVWLTARGLYHVQSCPMQRRSRTATNMLNAPPRVMKQMFAAIRLWLARGAQESFRGYANAWVADPRAPDSACATLTQIQKTECNADARQLATHGQSRALSLVTRPGCNYPLGNLGRLTRDYD